MKQKLILVSNDDGVHAQGIKTLVRYLRKLKGVRVVVVAPDREKSAASHSLTIHRPLRYEKMGKDIYAVDGTPTDCVVMAVHEILKCKPDLVVSGINHGANLGEDIHYSGTVSAAMEAAIAGIPGIALSLVLTDKMAKKDFTVAAGFAVDLVKQALVHKIPSGIMLNVNVPHVAKKQLEGVAICKMGRRNYGSLIVEKLDPKGRKYYWITGDQTGFENIKDSDCNAYLANKISVTPIQVDMTYYPMLNSMRHWRL